jgi:beta-lactamase superfamily II metal-dependent hydrolase
MTVKPNRSPRDRGLTLYLFNVGQGDHMLLRLPNGEFGIIDFFHESGMPAPPAMGYLQRLRRRLDPKKPIVLSFICLSHPDYDHIKGLETFLDWIDDKRNNIHLKTLWMWPGNTLEELIKEYEDHGNSIEKDDNTSISSDVGKQLRRLFKFREDRKRGKRKVKFQYLQDVQKLAENAGGVKVVTLAPLGEHVRKFDRQAQRAFVRRFAVPNTPNAALDVRTNQNLLSSILMLIYSKHRLLFGGDAGKQIWKESFQHYKETEQEIDHGDIKASFIKVSHHGSKHSSATRLWPEILHPGGHVAISAGSKRQYRHPHPETLVDILAPFPEPANVPRIWATNTCDACMGTYQLTPEPIDWVLGERPDLDPIREKALGAFRKGSKRRRRKQRPLPATASPSESPKHLAAYIFRFQPDATTIKVSKGVSRHCRIAERCSFETRNSPPFPLCAIHRLRPQPAQEEAPSSL